VEGINEDSRTVEMQYFDGVISGWDAADRRSDRTRWIDRHGTRGSL